MVTYNRILFLLLILNKPYNEAFDTLIVNFYYNSLKFEDDAFNTHTGYNEQATVLDIEAYVNQIEEERQIKVGAVVIDYINILANYRNQNTENTYMKIKQMATLSNIGSIITNIYYFIQHSVQTCLLKNVFMLLNI